MTSISGLGLDEGIEGTYYEALYPASTSIATAAFTVSSTCNVLFCCTHMPAGVRSVQLKKVEQGQLLKVSPQWQMVTATAGSFPAKEQTAVGFEGGGEALWLSLKYDAQMRPQVGKIRPHLAFHYARTVCATELLLPQPHHYEASGWTTLYPGVLVNAQDFTWVGTDLKHVDAILPSAVPLIDDQEGAEKSIVMYGARIRFCGWQLQHRPYRPSMPHRHVKRPSYTMMTSGELVSLLPGKLEVERPASGRHTVAAIFTWGGTSTSRGGLEENQPFELLCFKPSGVV